MAQTGQNLPRRGTRGRRGFTLTELMVALLIMGLIMSVVYRVFSSQERFFRNQEQVASMQENLRATMEYINQELSWLGYKVPGIAVIKAAPSDIIFKANIPNTGTTIQFVRYQFDPSTNTIRRAAGADQSFVENVDLTVMASDIEAMSISYYNILNGVVATSAADPLCADELNSAVCAPGTPDDDSSLLMVQRVKARVTARTSKPDWLYTDPEGGPDPNYRKRKAVLDLRARNVEDVTLQGGQIVVGSCGYLTHSITVPGGTYQACPDREYYMTNYRPSPANNTWDDNPSITIQAYDMNGNLNTNPNQVTYVYAVADDGTPYNIYDPTDPYNVNNTIANGDVRYVSAQDLSNVATNTQVNLRFAYSDGVCTQVSYEGSSPIIIAPSAASNFYSGGSFANNGISVHYVDNSGSPTTLATPDKVAMCSTYGNERVLLEVRLDDDCDNPVTGESIAWSDGGFGGTFADEKDNGDGTYSATYIPPDSQASVSSVYTAALSAQWGALNPSVNVDFIAAQPHDIVIDSIADVTQAGIFQFDSSVLPRESQLGGNSGNSFQIERVDGQEVMVKFHIEDACGNRVYTEGSNITGSASTGNLGFLNSYPDGSYSYVWESNIGCGLETLGQNINISVSTITNPGTQNETVSFDLLTTRSSDPSAGPFVLIDVSPIGDRLQAGNTGDYVDLKATVSQYNPTEQYCTNIPGVFPVEFTATGGPTGDASFSNIAPFDDTSETVDTDALGVAYNQLYSGTADWDDSVTVTATANIDGATYSGNVSVYYRETFNPQVDSGIYPDDNNYTAPYRIGSGQPVTTFDPGKDLYLQIFDYDENENPNGQDSFPAVDPALDVFVTLQSALTGDIEEVGLSEMEGSSPSVPASNAPTFRKVLHTSFFPAVATTLERGDGVLQVRDGDTITMHYEDKDNHGDAQDWTIYTPGADTFRLFKVGSPDEEILPPAGPTQVPVAYGDHLRPELSLSFLAGDGRFDQDTVTITMDSGADSDTLVLREDGDTGIMVPDDTIYAGKHFTVSQSDPSDASDVLLTPSTPRYVTLVYDAAGSYTKSLTFFMRDYDPPDVVIDSPDGTVDLSGQVDVMISANDVGNATTWSGISKIELYIGGRLYYTLAPGSDLSGSNTIVWTTASGTTPYWLDGSYVLTARAYDTSGNVATSAPVSVTVDNGLSPIWIDPPDYNSIWSQDVGVYVNVGNLASEAGTYQVILSGSGGAVLSSWTGVGSGTFNYTLDTTVLPEGSYGMIATIRDLFTNEYQTTALDVIVDRTPPNISVGTPPPWIGIADFPVNVQATVTDTTTPTAYLNDVAPGTVTGAFSGACSTGAIPMVEFPAGSDIYPVSLNLAACGSVDGLLRLTVSADDVATPANHASRAFSTMVDTIRPTVDSLTVLPMVNQSFTMGSAVFDGFVRGNVTLSAAVFDNHLTSGVFAGLFFNDPGAPSLYPDWTDFKPFSPVLDASSGTFSSNWNTAAYDDGIYVLVAGVKDAAGNSNATSPTKILYVDNGVPATLNPDVYLPMGIARGPVYVTADSQANDGFLEEVEHRFVKQGGNPANPGEVVHSGLFNFTAQSMTRSATDTYVMDTSSWDNGVYVGYSYVTDWAGNTSVTGPSAPFQVDIKRLDSLSASFTSIGPDQFQMSATGQIVDGAGNGVGGENLNLTAYRYIRECATAACTSWTYVFDNSYTTTQITDGSGIFTLTVPTSSITFENPTPNVKISDYYLLYVRNSSGNLYGNLVGYLDDPPLQLNPYQYVSTQQNLISNLRTTLDPYGADWRITVSGNLIGTDGQPAENVSVRFRMYSYDPYIPGYDYSPSSSTYYETTTGAYGAFSYQVPVDLPDGPYWFRLYLYNGSGQSLGSLYQPSPTPGTVQNELY